MGRLAARGVPHVRLSAIMAIACLAAVCSAAFEWPVVDPQIVRTFGEQTGDHLLSGMVLQSPQEAVRPIADAELVFSYRADSDYSSLPRGLGDFVVVEHSANMRSIYGYLDLHVPPTADGDWRFGLERSIGRTGASGVATGQQLFLSIMDTEAESVVNPLLLLPPLMDPQAPVIRGAALLNQDGAVELGPGLRVAAGRYQLGVDARDLRDGAAFAAPLAPYRLELFVNGVQQNRLAFDALVEQDGQRVLITQGGETPGVSLRQLYNGTRIVVGAATLAGGQVRLQIVVADYAGNEATLSRTIGVLD